MRRLIVTILEYFWYTFLLEAGSMPLESKDSKTIPVKCRGGVQSCEMLRITLSKQSAHRWR
jgi:hypothetical protein